MSLNLFDSLDLCKALSHLQITPKMRAILVDWLIQVHIRFHLLPETLFLCVNILDRFIAAGLASKVGFSAANEHTSPGAVCRSF